LGLEIRFGFLSKKLLNLIFSIDPILRMPSKEGMEKWLLREAFAGTTYLPLEVLYRPKDAFSDAISTVSRSWFEIIRDHLDQVYTDEELEKAKKKYIHMPIVSKESLHYRLMFEQYFGTSENTQKITPYYWLPKWTNNPNIIEPSARILDIYKNSKIKDGETKQ